MVEAVSEEFEYVSQLKAKWVSEKSEEAKQELQEVEDYAGKKYILQEIYKLIKIICLHKYEVHI